MVILGGIWAEDGFSATLSERCGPFQASETQVYRDARIFHSKQELEEQFHRLYESGHRLNARAYYDSSLNELRLPYRDHSVPLSKSFVNGLIRHIELAHKNSYVDYVYYPDMGHGHLYLPKQEWERLKQTQDPVKRMERVLQSPHLKALYHTVELLQIKEGDFASGSLPQDPWKLWRYFSRNLLGDFQADPRLEVVFAGSDQFYNTVRNLEGYVEVTIFYISSSKDGCLSYGVKDETLHFDVTLEGPGYESAIRKAHR